MNNEIAVRNPSVPSGADMNAAALYAERLASSGLLPAQYRRQPANVLYAIEYGRMVGLAPMAAITGVHVIEGKPGASAALISALVRRAGHKLRVTGNGQSATAIIIRADDPDFEYRVTWTLRKNSDGNPSAEESKLLNKAIWQQYPASMLKARAISQVARDACEEVLFGLHYTPEELGAEVDEEGEPVAAPSQPQPQYEVAEAVARKAQREQQERVMVDIAPRDQANPIDPDFELPASIGSASNRPATDAQLGKLAILVGEKRGVSGGSKEVKAARLAILGAMVDRELSTGRDLTLREASELIERLSLEPNHVADLEVVEEQQPTGDSQLAADLAAGIQEAETEPELEAVVTSVDGAVSAGSLRPEQGNALLAAAQERRGGFSHRLLAEQTGVAA
ncbi:MAG TPA: hypothetical protein VL738_43235 [Dactylosporangium sp.]|nr:hypothetical protein [Dactylosporangium sp.]